jgi:hypothetical protein
MVHSFYISDMEGDGEIHFRFYSPAKEYLCVIGFPYGIENGNLRHLAIWPYLKGPGFPYGIETPVFPSPEEGDSKHQRRREQGGEAVWNRLSVSNGMTPCS